MRQSSSIFRVMAAFLIAVAGASSPARAQTATVLYNFGTSDFDPLEPGAPGAISQGRDGRFYSTAIGGGALGPFGYGAAFSMTTAGGLSDLFSLDLSNGDAGYPTSGLTLGRDGSFYGPTTRGGASDSRTMFKVPPAGTLTLLHSVNGSDGCNPGAPPIQASDGNFYGTTSVCGTVGGGTIYKLTRTRAFSFLCHGYGHPWAPPIEAADGYLYGTAPSGGRHSSAYVYRLTPAGQLTIVHAFIGVEGKAAYGALIQGNEGNLYGTTGAGGKLNNATVFRLTPSGTITTMHNCTSVDDDGPFLLLVLVHATHAKLYGVTCAGRTLGLGTIFPLDLSGTSYRILYSFDKTSTGKNPQVALVQHPNGMLYGETNFGGSEHFGTFYVLNTGLDAFVSFVAKAGRGERQWVFSARGSPEGRACRSTGRLLS